MEKKAYSNYNNPKYRTRKYSNKRLNGFRRKNEAAMAAGKELAEANLAQGTERVLVPLAVALTDPALVSKMADFKNNKNG